MRRKAATAGAEVRVAEMSRLSSRGAAPCSSCSPASVRVEPAAFSSRSWPQVAPIEWKASLSRMVPWTLIMTRFGKFVKNFV